MKKVNVCYLECGMVRSCHFDMHHFESKMRQVVGFAFSHHFDVDMLRF